MSLMTFDPRMSRPWQITIAAELTRPTKKNHKRIKHVCNTRGYHGVNPRPDGSDFCSEDIGFK